MCLACYVTTATASQMSNADIKLAQQILNKFSAVKIQMSNFIQHGPHGEVYHGTFYLQRPGKIRFFFKDAPLDIVSDGNSVLVSNSQLHSNSVYSLNKTPMKILLANRIDANGKFLEAIRRIDNDITLIFASGSHDGSGLYLYFDSDNHNLKKWTIVDQKGRATTLEILNVKKNIVFASDMFVIPYQALAMQRRD